MENESPNKDNIENLKENKIIRKSKKRIVKRWSIIAITISLMIVVGVYFYPRLREIQSEPEPFLESIRQLGIGAVFILILFGMIQVIIPFIPGEIVEILAGAIFGPWVGLLIVQISIALGVMVVYFLVKILGKEFAATMVGENFEKKYKFMDNPRRLEIIFFFTLLLPMVPKDIIAFIVPLSKVKLSRFLILNAIARTPAIIASTLLGNAVIMGEFSLTIIIMILSGIIGILGLIFNKRIVNYFERKHQLKTNINNLKR